MYSGAPRRSTCPSYLMKRPMPMNLVTGSRLAAWQRNASLRVSPGPFHPLPVLLWPTGLFNIYHFFKYQNVWKLLLASCASQFVGYLAVHNCLAFLFFRNLSAGKNRDGGGGWCPLMADIASVSLKIHHLRRLGAKSLLSVLVEVSD